MIRKLLPLFFLLSSLSLNAQLEGVDPFSAEDNNLNIGGDIFSDFNEDIESSQIAEDERFYRYGRLFSIQFGVGTTTFSGNRGVAYEDKIPSIALAYNYFSDFQNSFGLGFAYSQHEFFLGEASKYRGFTGSGGDNLQLGVVSVTMLRVHFNTRHYIDTSNLGTAWTYSNPYVTGRMEYWYTTNKFEDITKVGDDSGGAFGFAIGGGFDFPIELRETYLNIELLMHLSSLHDEGTANYQCNNPSDCGDDNPFYDDLSGSAYSLFASYVISW
jgi:hypothetical protein